MIFPVKELKTWVAVAVLSAGVVIFLCGISTAAFVGLHKAAHAEVQSEENAQALAAFAKTPFVETTLNTINGEPPSGHVPFVYPCTKLALVRTVTVTHDVNAIVSRTVESLDGYELDLPIEKVVHFSVDRNPNPMSPVITIASNWPKYTYLTYNTQLFAVPFASGPKNMQQIKFFIVDVGQPLPHPGDPPPKPPTTPGAQPSCPEPLNAVSSLPASALPSSAP